MKTSIKSLFALIAGVSLFAACEKQDVKEQPSLVNITITASQDTDTKTVLGENGQVNWSLSGEKLAVLQDNGTKISKKASSDGVSTDDGATMKFDVNFTAETAASFSYYAFYPDAASIDTPTDVTKTKIQLTSNQKPTATSFGPASDILVAKPLTGLGEQPSNLDLQFARIIAVGKMAVKNLNSTENVSKITFTAAGKVVTGRSYVDLSSATVTEYGYSGQGADNVVLDYTDQTIAANGMTAYFTCWPFELSAGDKFTVKVETESQAFTKEVTVPDGKSLAFNTGRASAFSVDFTGIEGENTNTSVDLPYASLTFEEIKDNTNWGSYGTAYEYQQDNGAKWEINAYHGTNNFIQVGKAGTGTSGAVTSYIKLPDFKNPIRTVKITLSTSSYAGTLALCTTATAISGDIATDSGSKTTFEYDLTDKNVTTAYIRSLNNACQGILSIEVTAGEDTRTNLATPSVIAYLDDSDVNVTNSIVVEWDAVENAGSYEVTATPANGNPMSETVAGTTYTFTGLAYETEYTISVIAKPADAAAYKDSEAGVCEDKVTTGAGQGGEVLSLKFKLNSETTGSSSSTYVTTAKEFTTNNVSFVVNQWNPSSLQIKCNQTTSNSNFQLRNTTAIPGKIRKISIIITSGTFGDLTKLYISTSSSAATAAATSGTNPVNNNGTLEWTFTGDDTYFTFGTVKGGMSGTVKADDIIIEYE